MSRFLILAALLLVPFISATSEAGAPSKEAKYRLREAIRIIREARVSADYAQAEREFEEALRLAPAWGDAHAGLASLAEAMGKQTKAIREYERYLELTPQASDRQQILTQIDKLRRIKESRNRLGMAWVTLITLDDGIYIANVSPGSRIEKAGLKKGDRITMVNRHTLDGKGLEEFYRILEMSDENTRQKDRLLNYARKQGVDNAVFIRVLRGGYYQDIACNLDIFRSAVRAAEEDDLDMLIRDDKPVLLAFWAHGCPSCKEFIQTLEEVAERYQGQVNFVTMDADSNKKALKQLGAADIPASFFLMGGKKRWHLEGKKRADEIEQFLQKEGIVPTKLASGSKPLGVTLGEPIKKETSDNLGKLVAAIFAGKAAGGAPREGARGEAAQSPAGVCIQEVLSGSAAERAGIRKGDRIVSLNGETFSDMTSFASKISALPEGRHRLVIHRDGGQIELEIHLPPPATNNRLGVRLNGCDAVQGV